MWGEGLYKALVCLEFDSKFQCRIQTFGRLRILETVSCSFFRWNSFACRSRRRSRRIWKKLPRSSPLCSVDYCGEWDAVKGLLHAGNAINSHGYKTSGYWNGSKRVRSTCGPLSIVPLLHRTQLRVNYPQTRTLSSILLVPQIFIKTSLMESNHSLESIPQIETILFHLPAINHNFFDKAHS